MAESGCGGLLYELSKLLECPVCMETFENPKQLWCGHALCSNCVNTLAQPYAGLRCPLCRIPTKITYNRPPRLYIVQDFVQLYNKAVESRKYVEAITPLLKNNSQPVVESANYLAMRSTISSVNNPCAENKFGALSARCLDCYLLREVNDLWICTRCATGAICSRCVLFKRHAVHNVTLYVNVLARRKFVVKKWRENLTWALDQVYKNRTDLEYSETRLNALRLRRSTLLKNDNFETMNFSTGNVDVGNSTDEFAVLQALTSNLKNEFIELRHRLGCLQNESLLGSEVWFRDELALLSITVKDLHIKQIYLLKKQQILIDALTHPSTSFANGLLRGGQFPLSANSGYKYATNQQRHVINNNNGNRSGGRHGNGNGEYIRGGGGRRRPAQIFGGNFRPQQNLNVRNRIQILDGDNSRIQNGGGFPQQRQIRVAAVVGNHDN